MKSQGTTGKTHLFKIHTWKYLLTKQQSASYKNASVT